MKRLTYWCNDGMGSGEWRVNVKKYEDSGTHVDRLAAIEDILGDDYDLSRLRKLVQADREGRCVVNGEWLCAETDDEQFFLCSICNDKEYWESNYCPECGAKMDAEQEE